MKKRIFELITLNSTVTALRVLIVFKVFMKDLIAFHKILITIRIVQLSELLIMVILAVVMLTVVIVGETII